MISIKQSHLTIPRFSPKPIDHRRNSTNSTSSLSRSSVLPPISTPKFNKFSLESIPKPLHVSSIQSFGLKYDDQREKSKEKSCVFVCKAYEADRSEGEFVVEKIEAAKRVKIGLYFATWWFLNVIFNIYNKKLLNAFPYPWLTSTLCLAAGSAIMLVSWATKVAEAPNTDLDFWKALFPVSKF